MKTLAKIVLFSLLVQIILPYNFGIEFDKEGKLRVDVSKNETHAMSDPVSCAAILQSNPSSADGQYTIDPDGA
jgi:hypothetical protein